MPTLERCRAWIARHPPVELESLVRGVLIHYFFHVSDRQRIVFDVDALPGVTPRLSVLTPTVFKGEGRIVLAPDVVFGVPRSPGSHACSYVEARTAASSIHIGAGTVLNNRATLMSEGASIRIGRRCLIGAECQVVDSNFHRLGLGERHLSDDRPADVVIDDDVFIGNRVTVLKGARIGRGAVLSAGCMVPPSFVAPPFSIVAGNPARVVGRVADTAAA